MNQYRETTPINPDRSTLEDDADVKLPHGTLATTVVSILCNVIGGGVLGISTTLDSTGVFLGLVLLVYVAFISTFTVHMLTEMAEHSGHFSYMGLWRSAFSKKWEWVAEVSIFLFAFLILVAYLVFISDSMHPLALGWFHLHGFVQDGRFWVLITAPFLFVFSTARHLTELAITSFIAFATIFYVGVVVLVRYGDHGEASGVKWTEVSATGFGAALPVMAFAYSMHFNAPPLYRELSNRTPRRMLTAVCIAMGIIFLFYTVIALTGYLTWGPDVSSKKAGGDLIALYPDTDTAMNVGRFLLLIHFSCVFPVVSVACRRSFNLLVFGGEDELPTWLRVVQALAIVGIVSLLAMFASGVLQVLSFAGSIFGIPITFTFPTMMYWRMFPEMSMWKRFWTVMIFVNGIVFSALGLYSAIQSEINSSS